MHAYVIFKLHHMLLV